MVKVGSGDLLNLPGKLDRNSRHQGSLEKYAMPTLSRNNMKGLLTQPDHIASKSALSSHFTKDRSRATLMQHTTKNTMPRTMMKYQNNHSKMLNRNASTDSIEQAGSQMTARNGHSVIVS